MAQIAQKWFKNLFLGFGSKQYKLNGKELEQVEDFQSKFALGAPKSAKKWP